MSLVDHGLRRTRDFAVMREPGQKVGIATNRQPGIVEAETVDDEGGGGTGQFGAAPAGARGFNRGRIGEMAVGRHAGERLRIEKTGRRRQAGVAVNLGAEAPDEKGISGVRAGTHERGGGAAVTIHRGIGPLRASGGEPGVARPEADQRNE